METQLVEKVNWLRLSRSKNVGPKTFHSLLKIYGTATAAINKIEGIANFEHLKRKISLADISQVEGELNGVKKYKAELLLSCQASYPKALAKIAGHPPVLTMIGNKELIHHEQIIAIVGARNASSNGFKFAYNLAEALGKRGIIIASGLAKGIDLAAHKGSIKTGSIAFIACGIDQIYPKENASIYKELSDYGAIISELPIGAAPFAQYFPQRNRLISGISQATAVIEAAKGSGSLITAKYCIEQGKPVFAVPGSPFDKRSLGTNQLLKEGANLLESADDILKFFGYLTNESGGFVEQDAMHANEREFDEYRELLLKALSYSPTAIDDIVKFTNIPIEVLNLLLVELELAGKIERTFGNQFNLVH